MSAVEDVLAAARGDAWWITLNRPDRSNAFDDATRRQLIEALRRGENAGSVATVVTGAGRTFCAGGHLGEIADATALQMRALYLGSLELFDAIRNHPKPVIAAVNGPAVGGGVELVGACDLAVCASTAFFKLNSVRLGSAPVLGGTSLLPLGLGEKRAKEAIFLGRTIVSREALELGLVNRVVEPESLEQAVDELVGELSAAPPTSLATAKRTANLWWNMSRHNALAGVEALVQSFDSGKLRSPASRDASGHPSDQ